MCGSGGDDGHSDGEGHWELGVAETGAEDVKFAVLSNKSTAALSLLLYRQPHYPVGVIEAKLPKGVPCQTESGSGLIFDFHQHPPGSPFSLLSLTPECQGQPGYLVLESALVDDSGKAHYEELVRVKLPSASRFVSLRFKPDGEGVVKVGPNKVLTWPASPPAGRVGLFRRGATEGPMVFESVAFRPLSLTEVKEGHEELATSEMVGRRLS